MKRIAVLLLGLMFIATAVNAASLEVTSVNFPEKSAVSVPFTALPGAPDAKLDAKVLFKDAQSQIDLSYQNIKPAILFGGDVTCYVLWAVTRDGRAENLGQLLASTPKGKISATTGKKTFALMVTAESHYLVEAPGDLVVFLNLAPKQKGVTTISFSYSDFVAAPEHAMESITAISWDSKEPLEMLQARKAYELAERSQAAVFARAIFAEAGESLDEAEALAAKSGTSKKMVDAAIASVELSSEAINISTQRQARLELMALIDERRAMMADLEVQAVEAEAQVAALNRQKQALRAENAKKEREMAGLSAMLGTALGKVAEARQTAKGYVVSLPDILFDLNKASLKREAERPLAKLAGILLIMTNFDVVVEGYTDSTGSPEYNLKLSMERAESVREFMATEGIDAQRLAAIGFGIEKPRGDNATPEGRALNRRVEIVLTQK
jgi:outer membrane protein OmpA-like peptidoglycan-associated protein